MITVQERQSSRVSSVSAPSGLSSLKTGFPGDIFQQTERILSNPPPPPAGSILRQPVPYLCITQKQFSHLIGDTLIKGTNLEGGDIRSTAFYRIQQLEFLAAQGLVDPKRVQEFKIFLQGLFATSPSSQAAIVAGLKTGESVLIAGGWHGVHTPGHAMVYEFCRRENGNYDFWIYNTGEGLQYHAAQEINGKFKIQRALGYENVLPEELGLSSTSQVVFSDFFEGLHRIAKSGQIPSHETQAQDLYAGAFAHIAKKKVISSAEKTHFATPQRSGTCSTKILNPLTFSHLCNGDHKAYKRLMFDLDFWAVLEYFQHGSKSDEDLYLLNAAAKKELRASAKLYEAGLLNSEEFQCIQATLQDLLQYIRAYEDQRTCEREESLDLLPDDLAKSFDSASAGAFRPINTQPPTATLDLRSLGTKPVPPLDPSSIQFVGDLKEQLVHLHALVGNRSLYSVVANWTKERLPASLYEKLFDEEIRPAGHSQVLLSQMESLIDALPIPGPELIERVPENQIKPMVDGLYELMELYARHTSTKPVPCPIRENRMLLLLAYIYLLNLRQDPSLSSAGIRPNILSESLENPFFVFYRPQDFELRKQIASLFPPKRVYFTGNNFITSSASKDEHPPSVQEGKYVLSRIRKNPGLLREIDKKASQIRKEQKEPCDDFELLQIAAALDLNPSRRLLDSEEAGSYFKLRRAVYLADHFLEKPSKFTSERRKSPCDCSDLLITDYAGGDKEVSWYHKYAGEYADAPVSHLCSRVGVQWDQFNWRAPMHRLPEWKSDDPRLELGNFNRDRHSTDTESDIMIMHGIDYFGLTQIFSATHAEPALQPTKLLAWMGEHHHLLLDEKMRVRLFTLFNMMFFKIVHENGERMAVFLFEELPKSPALQKQCRTYIEEGLNFFTHLQPNERPAIECCLFFLSLSLRLRAICPEISLPDERELLDKFLERSDLTNSEKTSIHLHQVLYAAKRPLDDETLGRAVASWFYILLNPLNPQLVDPILSSQAAAFIPSLSETLRNRCRENPQLLNAILSTCNLDDQGGVWQEVSHPVYRCQINERQYWEVNLLTGQIACEMGRVSSGDQRNLITFPEYRRLFGDKTYAMQSLKGMLSFEHPSYGQILISQKGAKCIIQRKCNGVWYTYRDPESIEGLPLPLLADHSHWQSEEEILVFPLKKPGECVIRINREGAYALDEKDAIAYSGLTSAARFFSRFERPDCIYGLKENKELIFARYSSSSGKNLRFAYKDGKWVWTDNPRYCIRPQQKKGLLGTIPNYLHLESKDKEEKILVPLRPLKKTKTLNRNVRLEIEGLERDWALVDAPQQGVFSFLEYKVEKGETIPLSVEGSLYYAYLLLAQKKPMEAAIQLDRISRYEPYSATSLEILKWIWDLPQHNSDHSPASLAVRLRAADMLNSYKETPEGKKLPFDSISVDNERLHYLGVLHHIPPKLRIHSEDAVFQHSRMKADKEVRLPEQRGFAYESPWHLLQSNQLEPLTAYRLLNQPKEKLPVGSVSVDADFHSLYKEALSIETPEERLRFTTQLHLYFKEKIEPYELELFKLIHFAMLFPKKAPPPQTFYQKKQDWLALCCQRYNEALKNDPVSDLPLIESAPRENASKRVSRAALAPLRMTLGRAPEAPNELSLPALTEKEREPLQLSLWAAPCFSRSEPDAFLTDALQKPLEIKTEELPYEGAIKEQLSLWEKELAQGVIRRQNRVHYKKIRPVDGEKLNEMIAAQQERTQQARIEIERLVYKGATPLEKTLVLGEAASYPDLDELIDIFAEEDPDAYRRVNPHLTPQEIQDLDVAIYRYLLQKTELDQAIRSKKCLEKLQNCPRSQKIQAEQALALSLMAKIEYEPEQERMLLVLESRANVRLRQNQVYLIRNMLQTDPESRTYRDIVAQLMMGGGKTSIVCSLLAAKARRKNRIIVAIAPAAQFASLRVLMAASQKKHFRQEVVPVSMTRNEMTQDNLQWLRKTVDEVQRHGSILLIKDEDLRGLQCEFIALLYALAHGGGKDQSDLSQKILLLQEILGKIAGRGGHDEDALAQAMSLAESFQTGGDALIDEVDVVLAPSRIVNYPVGPKKALPREQIALMKDIMRLHADLDSLSLQTTRESDIDIDWYRDKVLPHIFETLLKEKVSEWGMDTSLFSGLLQFVLGKQEDPAFLAWFKEQAGSVNEEEQTVADLIALCKSFATILLPDLINKKTNRHFGRSPETKDGKVVFYAGSDAPTLNEFGNPYEAGFCHFLTALNQGISLDQFRRWGETLYQDAMATAHRRKSSLDETLEADEFFRLTGIALRRLHEPGVLEEAWQRVNQSVASILAIEETTIADLVGYYTCFVSSNAQGFVDQVQTRRTLSGTPGYRLPSYHPSLAGAASLDLGVEGEIADQLMHSSPYPLFYPKATIDSLIDTALDQGIPPERLTGVIDAAGILKDTDGLEAARAVQKKFPHLDILFFGRRKGKDDSMPDFPMVLKSGHSEAEFIGSTGIEDLRKVGIDPERMFVIYDERHCEATDVLQKSDAINLLTVDEHTTGRTLFQAALRMRGFFAGQWVLPMLSQEAAERQKIETTAELIWMTQKSEGIQKAKEAYRSYLQKFDHIPRQQGLDALLQKGLTMKELRETFLAHEQALINRQEIVPRLQFSSLQTDIPAIEVLEQKAKENDSLSTQDLLNAARRDPWLPSRVFSFGTDLLGQSMQIQNQVQAEIQLENELELQIELQLQQELSSYSGRWGGPSYKETTWNLEDVESEEFPRNIPFVRSLSGLLEEYTVSGKGHFHYAHPYHEIFDADLLLTENLAHTKRIHEPVFCKMQKQADQHLIYMKEGRAHILMLSIADAMFFKRHLEAKRPQHMWLIHPNGHEISFHDHQDLSPEEKQRLDRTLLQIAVFNGNTGYLDAHIEQTMNWLDEGNKFLKLRFLRVKIENKKEEKEIFYRHILPLCSKRASL